VKLDFLPPIPQGITVADFINHRMGELEPWIDENFIRSVWFGMGESVNVKMIRDKFSGYVDLSMRSFTKPLTSKQQRWLLLHRFRLSICRSKSTFS
jgi:hypothetical protein